MLRNIHTSSNFHFSKVFILNDSQDINNKLKSLSYGDV